MSNHRRLSEIDNRLFSIDQDKQEVAELEAIIAELLMILEAYSAEALSKRK